MHCPRCGTTAAPNQQFCRSCGLRLDKIAELVGEELALQIPPTDDVTRLRERQKKFEDWAGIAGLSSFGLIMLLFIALVFFKIILQGGLLIIPGVALILLAVGATAMGVFQMYSKSLKQKLEERPLPHRQEQSEIDQVRAVGLPPRSVTEGTTELLSSDNGADTGKINA